MGALFLSALSCSQENASEPQPLMITGWSGALVPVLPLDQPVQILFSEPILAPVPFSWSLATATGIPVEGLRVESSRSELRLHPRLPNCIDLSGGSFLPDSDYILHFAALPALASLRSHSGAAFLETQQLHFRTAPLNSPRALSGLGGVPLRPKLPAMAPLWAKGGLLRIPFDGAFDPRSLKEGARWVRASDGSERVVSLTLASNNFYGSVLEAQLGVEMGWGVFELPLSIVSASGEPLAEPFRQFRVKVLLAP
ncbi:MAG: hypothetical protein HOM34_02310 [Planctomycetes bacterium]|nr:hypothetical protein [Planctomycetota bacterium]